MQNQDLYSFARDNDYQTYHSAQLCLSGPNFEFRYSKFIDALHQYCDTQDIDIAGLARPIDAESRAV